MNPLQPLFPRRLKKAYAKGGRYGLAIARTLNLFPALAAIVLLVLYRQLLTEWLPPDFPVAWLLAVIMTPVLASTRLRTFIQPADPFFLAPAQQALSHYFRRAVLYNGVLQSLKVALWMALLSPLFIQRLGDGPAWVMALVVLLLWKGFNLWLRYHELFSERPLSSDMWIRWVTSALVSFWVFSGGFFGVPLLVSLLWAGVLIAYHLRRRPPQSFIPWERLVAEELTIITRYYRWASQFIDVPQVSNEVRIRRGWKWLNRFPARIPGNSYLYLYLRSFLRYREPFGLTVRLTLVTGLAMVVAEPIPLLATALFFLGLWMTAVQLPWIRRIHRFQPWFRLYPLPEAQKTGDLSRLVWVILSLESILILLLPALFWSHPFPRLLLLLGGGWVFSAAYANWRLRGIKR